jgi:outer membrane biosynthesis protein TonB
MRRNARFWRNVILIALVHLGVLIALLRWAGSSKIASAQEITWLNTGGEPTAMADLAKSEETPTPEPERKSSPPEENQPAATPAKSEIQIPAATPHPTPSPSTVPKPSAKPSPKPGPRKKASPKPSATPEKKKSHAETTPTKKKEIAKKTADKKDKTASTRSEKESNEKTATTGKGNLGGKTGTTANPANASWYGNMLHDRFYREWEQPTTVVASGAKLSALAKIRIEKDGRISDFKLVRSSGNVVVDESVEAVGKKVTRVDALPAGIGSGGHYDVNINFALNSK